MRRLRYSIGGGTGGVAATSALFIWVALRILHVFRTNNAWLLLGAFILLLAFSWFHHNAFYAQYSISSSSSNGISSSNISSTSSLVVTENSVVLKDLNQATSPQPPSTSSSLMIRNDDNKQDQKSNSSSNLRKIPHRLIFTYRSNILQSKHPPLYYQNVMNTIQMYQQAWKEEEKNETTTATATATTEPVPVDVWFLTDRDCLGIIDKVEPALRRHFQKEVRGDFKGDICRVAALYDRGGYYFDVDMQAVKALAAPIIAPHIRFVSVLTQGDYFFQSFLAAEARSPIIAKTIQVIRAYYDEKAELQADFGDKTIGNMSSLELQQVIAKHEERLGLPFSNFKGPGKVTPSFIFELLKRRNIEVHLGEYTDLVGVGSLRTAYRQVVLQDGIVEKNETFLLEEAELKPEMYPSLPRQDASAGRFCNYIVHHPEQQQVYFFSRFVGSPKCRNIMPKAHDKKMTRNEASYWIKKIKVKVDGL